MFPHDCSNPNYQTESFEGHFLIVRKIMLLFQRRILSVHQKTSGAPLIKHFTQRNVFTKKHLGPHLAKLSRNAMQQDTLQRWVKERVHSLLLLVGLCNVTPEPPPQSPI